MPSGVVKMFMPDKGFGFIIPDDGGDDVLVHRKLSGDDRSAYLQKGDPVTYEVEYDPEKDKYSATSCEGWRYDDDDRGGRKRERDRSRDGGRDICRDFQNGKCDRGDRCRFAHIGGRSRSRSPGRHSLPPPPPPMGGFPFPPPPVFPPAPSLPRGWEMLFDHAGGRPYFRNRSTGKSQWTPPADGPPPPPEKPPPLERGWEQAIDPVTGRAYFRNCETGESSWIPPIRDDLSREPSVEPPSPPQDLPEGWEEAYDPKKNKMYYFNRDTGESTWTHP